MKDRITLMAIDIQKGFVQPYWGVRNNPAFEGVAEKVLTQARANSLSVIHVQHLSTEPESPLRPESPGVDFMDCARPIPGERVIQKTVNSAFIGTTLEAALRFAGIDTLILMGLTTDHCVSTSARMAANLGFRVFVISDGTATFDRTGHDGAKYSADQVHHLALASLHGEFATVLPSSDILRFFSKAEQSLLDA